MNSERLRGVTERQHDRPGQRLQVAETLPAVTTMTSVNPLACLPARLSASPTAQLPEMANQQLNNTTHNTMLHNTACQFFQFSKQHNTTQQNTAQYNATQHNGTSQQHVSCFSSFLWRFFTCYFHFSSFLSLSITFLSPLTTYVEIMFNHVSA